MEEKTNPPQEQPRSDLRWYFRLRDSMLENAAALQLACRIPSEDVPEALDYLQRGKGGA